VSGFGERGRASHVIGRAVLFEAARVLGEVGIPVMPLKGIWLQQFVYADALERAITDVDVLVPEQRYRAARGALEAHGWKLGSYNVSESTYSAPELPLPLDLHARLFTRGTFRMPTSELFERAHHDQRSFGVPVFCPDARDVLAHAVGHALKNGSAWFGEGHDVRDIPRIAKVFALSPQLCAAHLERTGLARAARFVLPLMAAGEDARFGAEVVAALAPDPVGAALVRSANALRTHIRAHARLASATGFALDSSLWRGAFSFGLRLWDKRSEHAPQRTQGC
jgi:hypothetical protein